MILKGIRVSGVTTIVEGVTNIQAEFIDDEKWLREAGLDPAVTAIQLVSYRVRDEWESAYFKPNHTFLMDATGKTIDRL